MAVTTLALCAGLLAATSPAAQAGTNVAAASKAPTPVTSREDRTSAAKAAAAQGSPVEVMEDRTESSQVFAQPDGTFRLEASSSPKWVEQPTGAWAPVDLTLVKTDSGLRPKMVPVDMAFSAGGDTALASLSERGDTAHRIGLSWPTKLPVPTVAGNVITYPDVAPDTDRSRCRRRVSGMR